MPEIDYLQLWATFTVLIIVLYYFKQHLDTTEKNNEKDRDAHLTLTRDKNELELVIRKTESEAITKWIWELVSTITESNKEHSWEHTKIMELLIATEDSNNKTHMEMNGNIKKNTESISILHKDIKETHREFKSLLSK